MKHRSKVIRIAVLLTGIVGLVLGFTLYPSWAVSRKFLKAINAAQSVTLVEYQGESLEVRQELVLRRVPASAKQIEALKKAVGPWFAPIPSEFMACFEPHHRVEMSNADGSVLRFDICFACGNFSLGSHFGSTPNVWVRPLRDVFTGAGMPHRTLDEYAAMAKSHPDYEELARKQREIETRSLQSNEAIRKVPESRTYSKEILEHMKSQSESK